MEITPYRVIYEALLLCWDVTGLVLEHCFLVPFAFQGVLASCRGCVSKLATEQRVALEYLLLLALLDLLDFRHLFASLFLLSLFLQLFVLPHQLELVIA